MTGRIIEKYDDFWKWFPVTLVGLAAIIVYILAFIETMSAQGDFHAHRKDMCQDVADMTKPTARMTTLCTDETTLAGCDGVLNLNLNLNNFGGCNFASNKCTPKDQVGERVTDQKIAFDTTFVHGIRTHQECIDYVDQVNGYQLTYLVLTIVMVVYTYLHSCVYNFSDKNWNEEWVGNNAVRAFVEFMALVLPIAYLDISSEVYSTQSQDNFYTHPSSMILLAWVLNALYLALSAGGIDTSEGSVFAKSIGANPNGKGDKPNRNKVKSIHW